MKRGKDHFYKCPSCGRFLTKGSLFSANNFQAKKFSDGKILSPMFPEFPELIKCKKCNQFLWLSKLEDLETNLTKDDNGETWQEFDEAEFPSIEDYFLALNNIINDREQERYIRRRIWWAFNDRIRKNKNIFLHQSEQKAWLENCEKLILLLNPIDINQKIMIAEINRNMGNFEECKNIIKTINTDKLGWLKDIIINECEKKNRWVVLLNV